MKNIKILFVALVSAALLSGCALNQMIKRAKESNLTVTPDPLEVHGGKVDHEVSATLPAKLLPSGKVYTMYSLYKYNDQMLPVGSKELRADDYPNNQESSTSVKENYSFDYEQGMNPGSMMLYGEAKDPKNGKVKYTDTLEIAKGLILTSLLVEDVAYSSYADHGYVDKEELIPTRVNFFFDQGRSSVNMSLSVDGKNNKDKNSELSAFIAEKNVTRTVTITGTHSPEGTETINSDLAGERAQTIEKIYRRQMKRYDYKGLADSIKFIQKPVIQDWNGLKSALASYEGISNESKSQMNNIVNGNGSFEDKEKELQKVSGYDKVFDEIYPTLRSAQTEILTVKPKKTPAQIAVLAKQIVAEEVSADNLKMEELLFAGSMTPSLEEKAGIYEAATKKGESWVAHNNLGATYIDMALNGDVAKAADAITQLEIARNLNNSSEVNANMGAAFILQMEYDRALGALNEAVGGNNEVNLKVNSMKGMIETKNADYDAAQSSLGAGNNDGKSNLNQGLAFLLDKEYEQASTVLDVAKDDSSVAAKAYYLIAVTAARQENEEEILYNIAEAVKVDPDLKQMALEDLEFRNYADQVSEAIR